MKKTQLKSRLKPIVKECINEILLEEGILSNLISEVVKGLQPIHTTQSAAGKGIHQNSELLYQQKQLKEQRVELEREKQQRLKEQKRKLLNATGLKTNVFEGVAPISQGAESSSPQTQAGSLAGVEPSDAGVDLSGIMKIANRDWSKMI